MQKQNILRASTDDDGNIIVRNRVDGTSIVFTIEEVVANMSHIPTNNVDRAVRAKAIEMAKAANPENWG
ncbi:MAG TPA: hypothetical protein VK473_12740 [Terriglobales bacterium]|nr:hypothetical protein [Terriglobales bacterium]